MTRQTSQTHDRTAPYNTNNTGFLYYLYIDELLLGVIHMLRLHKPVSWAPNTSAQLRIRNNFPFFSGVPPNLRGVVIATPWCHLFAWNVKCLLFGVWLFVRHHSVVFCVSFSLVVHFRLGSDYREGVVTHGATLLTSQLVAVCWRHNFR